MTVFTMPSSKCAGKRILRRAAVRSGSLARYLSLPQLTYFEIASTQFPGSGLLDLQYFKLLQHFPYLTLPPVEDPVCSRRDAAVRLSLKPFSSGWNAIQTVSIRTSVPGIANNMVRFDLSIPSDRLRDGHQPGAGEHQQHHPYTTYRANQGLVVPGHFASMPRTSPA